MPNNQGADMASITDKGVRIEHEDSAVRGMKVFTEGGSEITGIQSIDIDTSDLEGIVTATMVVVVSGFGRTRTKPDA